MKEPREIPDVLEARLAREWRSLVESARELPRSPLDLPPDHRMAVSRTALLAQLEEVRDESNALRGLVDAELAGRFANASWTLKELLAHMASWAREFRSQIEAASRGETFDYAIPYAMSVLGPNEWNQKEVSRRRNLELVAIFDEFEKETLLLEELVASLDEGRLYRPAPFPLAPSGMADERLSLMPAFVVAAKCLHDLHHFAQLRRILARLRG